jgi:hypothetical protein
VFGYKYYADELEKIVEHKKRVIRESLVDEL